MQRLRGSLLCRLIALVSLAGFPARINSATQAGFVQDRFVIGFWVPPEAGPRPEERYREIADANFTLVVGTSGLSVPEQLRLCEKFGLRALVDADGPAGSRPDGPACWGYRLADEPATGAFAALARQAAEVRTAHPGRFGYINLLPNYASPAQLGATNYDDYVARFVREVKPEVLSMDHYPLMRPDGDSRAAYRDNLETFRRHANAAGIPFWNYFYSMPFNDRLDPTEAQIRWQIYTSLAYGAKGVLYFCYWTPGKGAGGAGEFPKGGAILTAEGRRTRHYDEARRINAELKNLGPTLMSLTAEGVTRLRVSRTPSAPVGGGAVRSVTGLAGDPPAELEVGVFHDPAGRRAVLLVNDSYAYTAWFTVEFDADLAAVREVNKATGQAESAVDDSPELKGFQVSLGAGDGRLFLLPPAGPR